MEIEDLGSHEVSEARKAAWFEQTDTPYDFVDAIANVTQRDLRCPQCLEMITVREYPRICLARSTKLTCKKHSSPQKGQGTLNIASRLDVHIVRTLSLGVSTLRYGSSCANSYETTWIRKTLRNMGRACISRMYPLALVGVTKN